MKKISAIVSTSLLLSGCFDNSPSSSEIKKELERSFSTCELVEVINVKKTNGEKGSNENLYLVNSSFELKFKPLPGIKEKLKKLEELQSALDKTAEIRNIEHENYSEKVNARYTRYREIDNEIRKEADAKLSDPMLSQEERSQVISDANNKLKELEKLKDSDQQKGFDIENNYQASARELSNFKSSIKESYNKLCKFTDRFSARLIGHSLIDDQIKPEDLYYNGGVYSYEYSIPMKKTENGWKFNM